MHRARGGVLGDQPGGSRHRPCSRAGAARWAARAEGMALQCAHGASEGWEVHGAEGYGGRRCRVVQGHLGARPAAGQAQADQRGRGGQQERGWAPHLQRAVGKEGAGRAWRPEGLSRRSGRRRCNRMLHMSAEGTGGRRRSGGRQRLYGMHLRSCTGSRPVLLSEAAMGRRGARPRRSRECEPKCIDASDLLGP